MGAAGAIVVAIAVLYGLTFLTASLAVLGSLVDWWPGWVKRIIPWLGSRRPAGTGVWHAMAIWVMRRPWFVLVPALIVLLVAGTPCSCAWRPVTSTRCRHRTRPARVTTS